MHSHPVCFRALERKRGVGEGEQLVDGARVSRREYYVHFASLSRREYRVHFAPLKIRAQHRLVSTSEINTQRCAYVTRAVSCFLFSPLPGKCCSCQKANLKGKHFRLVSISKPVSQTFEHESWFLSSLRRMLTFLADLEVNTQTWL